MLNLLWLLLPVAAAAGWLMGRRHAVRINEADWNYARSFHRDLNVLLAEGGQRDAELFIDTSHTDRDTADTQLAVGKLFRRRGEVDKAIRLHERLLEREELESEVHASTLLELARDYDSAGLVDRAEATLQRVIAGGELSEEALDNLLALKERDRDWTAAIETAHQLRRAAGRDTRSLVAHYFCELAEEARSAGYVEEAQQWLSRALESCRNCARANIIKAELALARHDFQTAIDCFEGVARQHPELMPEIIDRHVEALEAQGDLKALRNFVDRIRARRNPYSVIRRIRGVVADLDGPETADRFFKEQILMRPSLKGLRDWAQDQLDLARPGERDNVQIICRMLDQVVKEKPGYQCSRCGFQGNVLHWRCPSCGQWDSVHAIVGAEGE